MKTALITGGAQRIGAQITKTLHQNNYNVIIHYLHSEQMARNLMQQLNQKRSNSADIIRAELSDFSALQTLSQSIKNLEVLVNNASVFYPTPMPKINQKSWQQIINTNLMAPFFLSTLLSKVLSKNQGCIINIVDIHAQRPLKKYPIYNISKAGLTMMTKTLAKELAPNIRVCGVAPGAIFWPENEAILTTAQKDKMLNKIALKKSGNAKDIADTVLFLTQSNYITGQIINVDGGRTLNQ